MTEQKRPNAFYYSSGDQRIGPVTGRQIKSLAKAGKILPTDTIWPEGTEKGIPASKIKNLFDGVSAEKSPEGRPDPMEASSVSDQLNPIPHPAPVFISHSARDANIALQIVNSLEAASIPCWIAPRNIVPGSDYNAKITEGIRACSAMLVVESRHSAESDQVIREIDAAANRRIPVIPVRIEATQRSEAMEHLLRTYQWIDTFPPPIDRHFETIISGVKQALHIAPVAPKCDPNALPKYIGPYRILDLLGEGGMGSVYRAEQRTPIRRTVALKRIKPGMDSKDVLARFESERQALARMDHPNIAKVLDAGADERGRPFFVMEYVPGKALTEYADENKLSIEDRLKMFTQVCQAIGHAHTKAIIHRDVKPSNVLAYTSEGHPVVKVIDFGIAKALTADRLTDRTGVTAQGFAIGTYEYMSPEQAEGSPDIDTRTDVYSLGVLLYEFLSGAKPFDSDTLAEVADEEIRRIIREVEPPRPSTRLTSSADSGSKAAAARSLRVDALASQLKSELEWIPLMAMRKERERRYESPLDLAEDIENYLADRPLKAGPETLAYRARKTLKRNRTAVAAALLSTIVFASGIGFYVYSIKQEQKRTANALVQVVSEQKKVATEQEQKQKALEDAQVQTELAAKRFEEKRDALDKMLTTFSDDKLQGQPGSQPIRKLFLERGIEQYRIMLADRAGDPTVSLRTGEALRELGIVVKELGNPDESLVHLVQAVDVCRAAVAANPNNTALSAALGDALFEQAQALFEQQRLIDAKPYADESVEIFRSLSEKMPQEIDYRAKWGRSLIRRATLLAKGESPDTDQAQALKLLRAVVEAEPNNPAYLIFLARAINNDTHSRFGIKPEALDGFREAVDFTSRALQISPALPLANALRVNFAQNVSKTLISSNRAPESLAYLDGLLPAIRQQVAENPAVVDGPVFLTYLLAERAKVQQILNRPDDAIKTFLEIVQTNDALAQRDPKNEKYPLMSIEATTAIAQIHRSQKRDADAIQVLDLFGARSDEIMSLRPSSKTLLVELLRLHQSQGEILSESERYEQASIAYQRALDLYDSYHGGLKNISETTTYQYLLCCEGLVSIAKTQKNTALAIELLEKRIQPIDPETLKNADYQQQLMTSLAVLASLYAESGQQEQALQLRLELVTRATALLKGDPSSNWFMYQTVIGSHQHIAVLYRKLRNDRGSFDSLRQFFAETEPYVSERDHSALLAETADFTQDNLKKLWEVFDARLESPGPMKRFTIPVDFNGVTYPFHIYVAESWKYLEDQFRWIETVRGGKFPQDHKDSFRRLYDMARTNKVSFPDLCVYSLSSPPNNSESIELFEKVAKQKELVLASPHDTELRLELVEGMLTLAQSMELGVIPSRALLFIEDASVELDSCLAQGVNDDTRLSTARAAMDFIRGKVLLGQGRADAAYNNYLKAIQAIERSDESDVLRIKDLYVELGNASVQRKQQFEAATWYIKAAEAGVPSGLYGLARLVKENSTILRVLPNPVQELMTLQPKIPNEKSHERLLRLWRQYSMAIEHAEKLKDDLKVRQLTGKIRARPNTALVKDFDNLFKDVFAVVLLRGKNPSDDQIYSYVKITFPQFKRMYESMLMNGEFRPNDFGEVIAEGVGEPSSELQDEIARLYPITTDGFGSDRGFDHQRTNQATLPSRSVPHGESITLGPWDVLIKADTKLLPQLLAIRATEFAKLGQIDEVTRSAAKLREIGNNNKQTFYDAACAYSLSAGLVVKAMAEPNPIEIAKQKRYLDLAITCLKEAIAAGFTDFNGMARDEDFAPLRDLPEFKSLLPKN